jgi:hypothetical protein
MESAGRGVKPRGNGFDAPGTNMAVHRGDQVGGQGSAAIPRATGLSLWFLRHCANQRPPAVPRPWSIGVGTSGQGAQLGNRATAHRTVA